MYLENLEQLIIWNGGSINLYNFQNYIYLFIYLFITLMWLAR
jgi:ABC-type Fe3+-siderophore transport system permease subunit